MFRIVALDRAIAVTSPCRSPDINVTPADSIATSVPVPIAIPTSADARAGASLIPSPTMATLVRLAWSALTAAALPSGRTSARTRSMPSVRAIASAVRRLSPVSITTCNPRRWSSATAAAEPTFGVSATAMTAAARPSSATKTGVLPSAARASAVAVSEDRPIPASSRKPGRPTSTARPPTTAAIPPPAVARKSVAGASARPRASTASRTIASPSGCSERRSAAATRASSSPSAMASSIRTMSVTRGLPSVSVPVLSRTTTLTDPSRSSASALRNRTPASAPLPVPTMIEVGVARPSAHGQAMIRTATVFSSARLNAGAGPSVNQATNVRAARPRTAGTK